MAVLLDPVNALLVGIGALLLVALMADEDNTSNP
jgi:hypothetical protein